MKINEIEFFKTPKFHVNDKVTITNKFSEYYNKLLIIDTVYFFNEHKSYCYLCKTYDSNDNPIITSWIKEDVFKLIKYPEKYFKFHIKHKPLTILKFKL